MEPKVMILLGSVSDFPIAEKAINILEIMEIPYDVRVASAHRTHEKVKNIVKESTKNGVEVFMGIAGLSAHLSGIIAANTHKPVVGVPVEVKLGGLDALFATVQMPLGAPVATVGVDRGENGAILASQIIGLHDAGVRENLSAMRDQFFFKVDKDEEKLSRKFNGKYYSKQSIVTETLKDNKTLPNNQEFGDNEILGDDENLRNSSKLKKIGNGNSNSPEVAVIAGSYSDIKVAKKTTMFLDKMNLTYDSTVVSPIRNPERFEAHMEKMKDVKLYIAISGLSAHVTGAVVAYTEKPVIGVPCAIRLDGMDALFSMVNMPPGVPVATMGIDAGGNAALLATEMLSIGNEVIEWNLLRFKGNINCKR
jgi:5-(carboxyamino)imidazole ribonucleotide mutase